MNNLQSLIDISADFDNDKEDYRGTSYGFNFTADQWVQMQMTDKVSNVPVTPYGIRDNVWSDIAAKLGPAFWGRGSNRAVPKDFLLAMAKNFPDETAHLLQAGMEKVNGQSRQWFVRTYKDEVRAVLSTLYADVRNTQMLQVTLDAIDLINERRLSHGKEPVNPTITRSWVTPDEMMVRIGLVGIDPGDELTQTPDGRPPYMIGFQAGNGEIGNRAVSVTPFFQRGSCTNSTVIQEEDSFYKRHIGVSTILISNMAAAIGQALKMSEEYLWRFLNSKTIEIPDISDVIDGICERHDWVDVKTEIALGTEQQRTVYGLLNGITYAAQSPKLNQQQSESMEAMAGSMLSDPRRYLGTAPWVVEFNNLIRQHQHV